MEEKTYNTHVVIGMQFGDEGKGKIIQRIAKDADFVVKFQGGNNAGHTVYIGDQKETLNMLPLGVLSTDGKCIIAAGTVIDVETFLDEVYSIEKNGKLLTNLFIDGRAQLIMPYHSLVDQARENILGKNVINVSKNGIAPCYADKVSKMGIRVSDLLNVQVFTNKLQSNLKEKNDMLEKYSEKAISYDYIFDRYNEYVEKLRYRIIDGMAEINKGIDQGKKVVFEGCQALMLDPTFGTYPNVASTVTTVGAVCTGAGVAPNKIKNVIGVFKAYTTRNLDGILPTEINDNKQAEYIIERGHEYILTTTTPRRCGWLDLVILRYGVLINGVTELCMTKLDVLSGLKKIKLGVAYEFDGLVHSLYPMDYDENKDIQILYKEFDGWDEDISGITEYDDLPKNCKRFIEYIEGYLEVKITLISVGPKQEQSIIK